MGHVTWLPSFQRRSVIRWLVLPRPTNAKFEVSIRSLTTNYAKGNAKCRKWGGCGWLGVIESHRQHTIRQSTYNFLFDFNRHYTSILYRFQLYIARYLSKVANFNLSCTHWRPHWGRLRSSYAWDLWRQKTRVPGISCSIVCVILYLAVLVEHWTDGQIDIHNRTAVSYTHLTLPTILRV